jgi:ATP phosphoribosyltransferase regulatory subunit
MVSALRAAGVNDLYLDLGHVAVFRSLIRHGRVDRDLESELFRVLQSKDIPTLRELVAPLDAKLRDALLLLPELYGGLPILQEARRRLPDFPDVRQALTDMETIAARLSHVVPCTASISPNCAAITITRRRLRRLCQRSPQRDRTGRALR